MITFKNISLNSMNLEFAYLMIRLVPTRATYRCRHIKTRYLSSILSGVMKSVRSMRECLLGDVSTWGRGDPQRAKNSFLCPPYGNWTAFRFITVVPTHRSEADYISRRALCTKDTSCACILCSNYTYMERSWTVVVDMLTIFFKLPYMCY